MASVPVAGVHVWREHDTWWALAERYTGSGQNWVLLANANLQIRNPNRVPVGTVVKIPGGLVP